MCEGAYTVGPHIYQVSLADPSIVMSSSFCRVSEFITFNPVTWLTVEGEGLCHSVGMLDGSDDMVSLSFVG
jgi:hypothetical protein